MALSDIRSTVITIVNAVERKMSISVSSSLAATDYTPVLLQLLNEVADDLADSGDWNELRQTITVSASSSTATYAIPGSGAIIQHISEIAFTGRIAGLQPVTFETVKMLRRASAFGMPNQWAIVEVNSSGDPVIEVTPVPTTAEASGAVFTAYTITKPRIWVAGDESVVPPFPAQVMINGLHAKALLEENGGEQTKEWQVVQAQYERGKVEARSRYTTDTSTTVRFVPRRGYP